ncbi:MAG: helicase-related protein [Rhodococcus sp. (in: high G+C Gram-positive bacteria)]
MTSQQLSSTTRQFAVGSLVYARGREWVVLPASDTDMLVLRPLGGGEDDIAGVLPAVEPVRAATFAPPDASDIGNDRSARLLRDALRVGFRSSGGPFRSLAGLTVSPRPYQLVPLLLALRQDTVRLLIADDVGIGKTVEAGLVAAELLAQGSAQRLAVLCPPSLADQWRRELAEKFGMDPQLVLPSTVTRLERGLEYGQSLFERYPVTIVSTDFIKAERRRNDFLRGAPDLVIIDEAHGVAADDAGRGGSGRTQRYRLVRDLADDADRHLVLVTATPHSGNDGAFRNLIGLLDPALYDADLAGESGRKLLAGHMVQRRRADIRTYLGEDTQFPKDRKVQELSYQLSASHKTLFDDVLGYVRGRVQDRSGTRLEQRVRWWSALSLLRSMASSPAAAAATLNTRAATTEAATEEGADQLGASEVLDQVETDGTDGTDITPGALLEEHQHRPTERNTLRQFRDRAVALEADPAQDAKLALVTKQVRKLLADGFEPIVFCRFIPTAHYVAAQLRSALKKIEVEIVTGELPAEERAQRIAALTERAAGSRKVLVATDCLSEGVNLQDGFQAVVHYDLAWNPTRHEQREGRVDRFGQSAEEVRALLIYGADNGIDGIILDVLLRKHEAIRRDLGISVPVPPQSDQVLAALLEGVLMRGRQGEQLELGFGLEGKSAELESEWRSSAASESRSRTRFAQNTIRPDEVQEAVDAARLSLGSPDDVAGFVSAALSDLGAVLTPDAGGFSADLTLSPIGLRDVLRAPQDKKLFVPDFPAPAGSAVLQRTDSSVVALADYVLNSALDPQLPAPSRPARRCGIIVSSDVSAPAVALLVRFRTHVIMPGRTGEKTSVAEEARVLAFTGTPTKPTWLGRDEVAALLSAQPTSNIDLSVATNVVSTVLAALPGLQPALGEQAIALADELREAHLAVRRSARGDRAGSLSIRGLTVTPQLPVDVLGVYVFRPAGASL